ncbi:MAG: APC family permease [Sphingomonas sp.]
MNGTEGSSAALVDATRNTSVALARTLGVTGVLFLTLSVTTPVSSLFVIVPGMLHVAGTGAIWAMMLAAIVCVATAYIYAELSSVWPVAGGEYVMVARTLGPLAGFMMLGVNVFNNLLFPPVLGLGLSAVLARVIPGLPEVPLAIGVVAAAALVALLQIRVNAWLTGLFLAVEVLAVVAVVALGFADPQRSFVPMLTAPVIAVPDGLVSATFSGIGLATSIAIFALNGYGAAVYFGEEMHQAPAKIGRTILWALGLTLACEGVPMVAVLIGAPDLGEVLASDDPIGMLVAVRGGSGIAAWVSIGVAVAIVNAIIACILACARFFYGTGRDRCWGRPVDAWLTVIHPRFASPWIATLLVGGAGIACCFVPLELLLVLSGTGLIAIYVGIALALIVGRRSGALDRAPFRAPLYPAAPVITLVGLGYVVWLNWLDVGEGRPGLVMTGVQLGLSAAYYRFVLRRRGSWDVHVPLIAK